MQGKRRGSVQDGCHGGIHMLQAHYVTSVCRRLVTFRKGGTGRHVTSVPAQEGQVVRARTVRWQAAKLTATMGAEMHATMPIPVHLKTVRILGVTARVSQAAIYFPLRRRSNTGLIIQALPAFAVDSGVLKMGA